MMPVWAAIKTATPRTRTTMSFALPPFLIAPSPVPRPVPPAFVSVVLLVLIRLARLSRPRLGGPAARRGVLPLRGLAGQLLHPGRAPQSIPRRPARTRTHSGRALLPTLKEREAWGSGERTLGVPLGDE